MKFVYIYNLDCPWLLHHLTEVHIVLGLTHSLLVFTKDFWDNGFKVMFDKEDFHVYYDGHLVLIKSRELTSGLWAFPIPVFNLPNAKTPNIDDLAMIYHGRKL